ncbi:heparinase II/III domain-containing protein [Lachnoclostridium phytofermentans]|uniref:Heparinase II/III family protein n=1 Tax=Lachnoclostridium phytofermentans (strain ATCC 700394 / DSM 18823 / ISDg) TaxID=357809 RepID=A9KI41_LACP7|nr:DUF4962 domain-containing protein [Lachnoclostridium phytofermentans]ABX40875.1 Heparinase II/III family protein [Lachnoclostridium phytofermentans ISDg]
MTKLIEPKSSILTIGYHPENEKILENPPRFTWMPESEKDILYRIQVSKNDTFDPDSTLTIHHIPYNFYTLDKELEPGDYYWRYTIDQEECSYSKVRKLSISDGLVVTPLVSREKRYDNVDMSHPRIWLNKEKIDMFREELEKNPNYCGFQIFLERSVLIHVNSEFVAEPPFYPGNIRVVELWRKNYQECQRGLEYIRSLSVAGVLLENSEYIEKAKLALLKLASWDTNGSTARDYNDECSFRVAYALAFGYDWLYSFLTKQERSIILESLSVRTRQVATHIIKDSRIHLSLYDSHAVRSLSSVLTPCCIAMLGESAEAKEWLDYTIEYFNTIYTPWGGEDGGWAEGGLYWTTGMAFVSEALNTIKSFLNIDIYKRPFFQKTGDFPLYCMPVDTYRASFCDQSNLGKYPGHKTAYNIRQFAGVTGNQNYQWYYEQVLEREKEIDQDFFNKGWWDFYFDDMVYRHDYKDTTLKEEKLERVKWFKDIGWVAINKDMKDPKEHIFLLTKSSPYGSVSHSHGDQNSFVLFAYGEPLIIKSGYYIGFNTTMHRNFRRQTLSHNSILINGKGQYAGMDKAKQLSAKGHICEVKESDNLVYIKEDATAAYQLTAPELTKYTREIYFVDDSYFILVDTVESEDKSDVEWLLHSLSKFQIEEETIEVNGKMAGMTAKIVYCSSNIESITQSDIFTEVDEKETDGLDNQWHLTMKTGKAKKHIIVSVIVPYKMEQKKLVNSVRDDQGMDIYLYFSYEGKTFSLCIDGTKRNE